MLDGLDEHHCRDNGHFDVSDEHRRTPLVDRYRGERIFLVGDAAHLNPPWGGHGFNTCVGDAVNLGWKMAAVLQGWAPPALLDSYDTERRKHARAMIDLSTLVGRVISPTNRKVAALRDKLIRGASVVPALKRYVLEMRFKPMPRYDQGAVYHPKPPTADAPAGTLFIQPRVDTREQTNVLLDDVIAKLNASEASLPSTAASSVQ